MTKPDATASSLSGRVPTSREDRLAERLRDNLRRRKAQARALASAGSDPAEPQADPDVALSKPPASG